jgi:hypothetical protein
VLVVDYDLIGLDKHSYITGESIAYLARCYSSCGYIVTLNEFGGSNSFDLSLRDHPESFADLNLGSDQLANPGLWTEEFLGFRPWSWPHIPTAVSAHRQRLEVLSRNVDRPVLEVLEIPTRIRNLIPRTASERLAAPDKRLDKVTFADVARSSQLGMRERDGLWMDDSLIRVAGCRVAKWLEYVVLPGQDLLVDAPHLVSRYSSLLVSDPSERASWNNTVRLAADQTQLGLKHSVVERYRFVPSTWLSRVTWFWPLLGDDRSIEEVSDPWKTRPIAFAFAEDMSSFVPSDSVREFVADLESPFSRRFAVNPKSPEAREWTTANKSSRRTRDPRDISKVQYRPALRWSL